MCTFCRISVVVISFVVSTIATSAHASHKVELNNRTFTLPDGFTIELVASTPLVDRPIVADFDEQGRLYVADSSGSNDKVQKQLEDKPHRIVRLEDTDGDGRYDKSVVFADRMMFPEGTMWRDGSLYVAAPPSIWKLTDTDGDGTADQRAEWFAGKTLTNCANDLHGPYAGPDGWIYWCKGAFAEQTYERPGRKPLVTKASHIFRSRPDGSGIEAVMTGGMDNPVDVVFTPAGDRILTNTFFQHPAGGKRDGLIHAIYGGVYGKVHEVIESHPRTGPDVMPVLTHMGPAAPCGLARYESEAFGSEYRDNLFCASFNLHKVTRHVLVPEGAGFRTQDHDFVVCDHVDFHPTDVIEDADGSLLILDTGGWYKLCCPTSQIGKPDVLGAIYRVRRTDAKKIDDPRGLKLDWAGMDARALARVLEDPRPAVRARAIAALGRKPETALPVLARVSSEGKTAQVRRDALWAAARFDLSLDSVIMARGRARLTCTQMAWRALEDEDDSVRQVGAYLLGLYRDSEAVNALSQSLTDQSPFVRRTAAEALGRIGDKAAVPALLEALKEPADRALEHALIYALIEIAQVKPTAAGLASANPRVRRAAMIALDQIEGGADMLKADAVAAEIASPDAPLREAAVWIAGRRPDWGDAVAGLLLKQLEDEKIAPDDRARLREQLGRLARGAGMQEMLAKRVRDESAPAEQRHGAMGIMAAAGLKEAPVAWIDALAAALGGKDRTVLATAAATVRRVGMKKEHAEKLREPLRRITSEKDLPAGMRLEAFAALASLAGAPLTPTADDLAFLTGQLAANGTTPRPAADRMLAADVIARAKLSSPQLTSLAGQVRAAGPLEMNRLVAAYEQSSDAAVGRALVTALADAKALAALRPDQLTRALARCGGEARTEEAALLARISPDTAAQKARLDEMLASMPAGDVRRGQALFNSPKAACASCHAIGYLGGKVGPDMTKIGAIRTDRDLLESIVFPSASFVQSYEPVMVDTRGGDRHAGILRRNDAEAIVLVTGPDQELRIGRTDVAEIHPSKLSLMPAGLDQQLTPQELADLVAFLKACR